MLYVQLGCGEHVHYVDEKSVYPDTQLIIYDYNIINTNPITALGCRDWQLKESDNTAWPI